MSEQSQIWKPELTSQRLLLRPLLASDFDVLHAAASDPLIWQLHPDPERYKLERFRPYFQSALTADGAFVITDRTTGEVLGSSRYYDHSPVHSMVAIGYTFLVRKCWGGDYNRELKTLMLGRAFQHVNTVYFVVGQNNLRSRRAMQKIGGIELSENAGLPLQGDLTKSVVFQVRRPN